MRCARVIYCLYKKTVDHINAMKRCLNFRKSIQAKAPKTETISTAPLSNLTRNIVNCRRKFHLLQQWHLVTESRNYPINAVTTHTHTLTNTHTHRLYTCRYLYDSIHACNVRNSFGAMLCISEAYAVCHNCI